MTKTMSTKDAEKLWGISQRRIISLCQQGKIKGAIKNGRSWEIPFDAEKPVDGRFKTGEYAKSNLAKKLPLPIGISDYRLASTEYYYIDKTMLIKDFLDERPMVSLFTRPRRFGKSLPSAHKSSQSISQPSVHRCPLLQLLSAHTHFPAILLLAFLRRFPYGKMFQVDPE